MKLGKRHSINAIFHSNNAIHYAKGAIKLDLMLLVMHLGAVYVFWPALFGNDLMFQIISWGFMALCTPYVIYTLVRIPADIRRVKDVKQQRINLLNAMLESDDPDAREQASRELQRKDANNDS